MPSTDLIVRKDKPREGHWQPRDPAPLEAGEARLQVETVALTSNNVTYAVFANFAGYWDHFPAADPKLGRVPHWGFATVSESTLEGLPLGTRVYGYLPVSTDLVVKPVAFDKNGFTDGSAHRAKLPPFYSRFHLTANDIAYQDDFQDEQMIVRPLYATGWLIDDYLMSKETPPAQVIVSSASSKTALAYAHKAARRDGIILSGLTSEGNRAYVESTGFYSKVYTYDELDKLPLKGPAIYTDFLGNPEMRPKLEAALGDAFAGTLAIGATAWDALSDTSAFGKASTTAPVEQFFAPGHADVCAKRLGPAEFFKAMNTDMTAFYPVARSMITSRHIKGENDILNAWQTMVDGNVNPSEGLILEL
ncbi:MAG: DUF2855 family protein [Pseudomonadota bacterium]